MFQQVFANYFKVAESAIQFQHELLRQWSGQWPTAPFANGRTQQVRTMRKKVSEDSSEMLNLQRTLLAMVTKPEIGLIEEERVSLEKRPAVREDVTVGKRVVQETEQFGSEVRKQEMRIEREQDVDRHAAPSWETSISDGEESEILRQAYLKWLEEGCPEGQDRRHYFEALKHAR
jgi:uncharacterized protein (TIGR02271 family)